MARMPQIPQPEIENRPDKQVGPVPLPSIENVEKPFQLGAQMADDLGAHEERLAQAQAKIQETVDTATALDKLGDHSDNLATIAQQLQLQNKEHPEKAVEAFQMAVTEATNKALLEAPTAGSAFKMSSLFAHTNNQARKEMTHWSTGQNIQNAKNKLEEIQFKATHNIGALDASQLPAHIAATGNMTAELQKQLTANPKEAARNLEHAQVEAWMNEHVAMGGKGVMDVQAALSDPSSFVYKKLTSTERLKGLEMAESAAKGVQKVAYGDLLTSRGRQQGQIADLLQNNDPKFMSVAYSLRQAVKAHMDADQANPALTPEMKAQSLAVNENRLEEITSAEKAYLSRRSMGQVQVDQKTTAELWKRHEEMFTKKGTVDDIYARAIELRRDNLKAFSDGHLLPETYALIENSTRDGIGKLDASQVPNIPGAHPSVQGPRQAGIQKINELLSSSGFYRRATQEQQNEVRMDYASQFYEALKAGRNVDEESAVLMALKAMKLVMTRK